jgi:hypothetical protein
LDLAECIGKGLHQAPGLCIAHQGAGSKRERILRRHYVQTHEAAGFGVQIHDASGP